MKFPLLYNFISPVTGRILSDPDYVLIGDDAGFATPSPIIIDIRLDMLNIRYDLNFLSSASFLIGLPNKKLPNAQVLSNLENGFIYNTDGVISTRNDILDKNLTYQYLWRGDQDNKPEEVKTIEYNNLPDLDNTKLIIGNSNNRPVATQLITMSNLPNLPSGQLITGNSNARPVATQLISIDNLPPLQAYEAEGVGFYQVWVGTNDGRPEASYAVSTEINILTAKFYTGGFIMKSGLLTSYPNAQFLTSLDNGIVKKITGGSLAHAIVGEDYMGMDLATDKLWVGNAQGKAAQVTTIKTENLPNLTQDKIYIGNSSNRPTESDVLKAKFITMDTTKHQDLPNSVIIGNLDNGLIAKQGTDIINASLTNKKIWIGDANNKPNETEQLLIDNLPNLTSGKIFWGNQNNRPVESEVLKAKFVIFDANQAELPNAVSLANVEDGFLAKSTNSIVAATITYQKLLTGDANRKIIEIDKLPYINMPDLQTDYLLTGDAQNRPSQILTIKLKNMPPLASGKMYFGSQDTVPQVIGLQEKYLFTGDSGGNISSVLRLDIDNYVNLTNNHIHIGNEQNRPIEKNISEVAAPRDAKYIIQSPDVNLPNAQALNALIGTEPRILKASSSGVIQVAVKDVDYATKEKLEEIRDETEQFKNQAEQAKQGAEQAKQGAETAKTEAQTQATAAQTHATTAQLQATAAQTHATTAQLQALAAQGSALLAEGSAAAAAASAAAAGVSAGAAATSATAAGVSATNASNAAIAAGASAAGAASSAFLAGVSAAAASGHASSADEAKDQAKIYRDEAEEFKNEAGISAANAGISENNASTSASAAGISAAGAAGSASAAAASLAALLATPVVLEGDITGSSILANPINTTFIANPSFSGNSFAKIPVGTTEQRTSTPAVGMMRFNTTTTKFEIYI